MMKNCLEYDMAYQPKVAFKVLFHHQIKKTIQMIFAIKIPFKINKNKNNLKKHPKNTPRF